MAIDTLLAYVGLYDNVADAEADYQLVKDLHSEAGLIDAYDAAVVERPEGGKTKLKQLGEHLDAGQAGLVVVAVADMGAEVEAAMERATQLQQKQLQADIAELERDAASVGTKLY
jgi:hypothetical protein